MGTKIIISYVIDNRENILDSLTQTRTVNSQTHGVYYNAEHNSVLEPDTVDEALGVGPEPGPDIKHLILAGFVVGVGERGNGGGASLRVYLYC